MEPIIVKHKLWEKVIDNNWTSYTVVGYVYTKWVLEYQCRDRNQNYFNLHEQEIDTEPSQDTIWFQLEV